MKHIKKFKSYNGIKVDEIDIESPFDDVKIGTQLDYSGEYKGGRQEGKSPVEKIFVQIIRPYDSLNYSSNIYARLENGKLIILGTQKCVDGECSQELTRKFIKF